MQLADESPLTAPSSTPPSGLAESPDPVDPGDRGTDATAVLDPDRGAGPKGAAQPSFDESGTGSLRPADAAYGLAGLVVAGLLSLFVFAFFNWPQPDGLGDLDRPLLFTDTTPSGGDMGAHVWGPAYLRDYLLPQGRLSGWTPDWYAGFPAYHFYMVIPPLLIVAVNAGLPWFLGLPMALLALAVAYRLTVRLPVSRPLVWIPAVAIAIMLVAVPYGISFKLVTVIGLIGFPLAAWKMGRLAGAAEPIPTFLALAGFIFLFDTNFTIYGGNIASTLAGEFSFSISIMLVLLAVGLASKGMDRNTLRAPAAVVIALVALTHVLPVFFMIPAMVLLVLMHPKAQRSWPLAATVAIALLPIALRAGTGSLLLAIVAVVVVVASAVAADRQIAHRAAWLAVTGPVAILVSAFWLLPFVARRGFFNDMGWEPLEHVGPALLTVPMKIALPLSAIGVVLSYTARERLGMVFGGTGALFAAAVANVVGEGPVWNARLLPFYYLSVYLTAAIGLAMIVRFVGALAAGDLRRPDVRLLWSGAAVAAVATVVAVAMPLRILPGGHRTDDGGYDWLVFSNTARSFVPSWIEWNYSGYEQKESYREYRQVVQTMIDLGNDPDHGCGRAMWEHHKDLDRYGTPMALMLLPHWTDGCIGSMEGLYFESSASTPFHFLNQSMLSNEPSRPQRDLPYQDFDIDRGIAQLQTSGVRYYLAQSDKAIEAARTHPDLAEVGEAQPFVVFEVAGSELVEALTVEPQVVSGRTEADVAGEFEDGAEPSRFDVGWLSQAVEFYNDPNAFAALPAEDGPRGWVRTTTLQSTEVTAVEAAQVSNVEVDTNRISFSVDQVGTPVLVKASFFPNWRVDGADGPWRVGPNLMVVVPTAQDVELSFGRSAVDILAIVLTLAGLGAVVALRGADRGRALLPAGLLSRSGGRAVAGAPSEAEGDDWHLFESEAVPPTRSSVPAVDSSEWGLFEAGAAASPESDEWELFRAEAAERGQSTPDRRPIDWGEPPPGR